MPFGNTLLVQTLTRTLVKLNRVEMEWNDLTTLQSTTTVSTVRFDFNGDNANTHNLFIVKQDENKHRTINIALWN